MGNIGMQLYPVNVVHTTANHAASEVEGVVVISILYTLHSTEATLILTCIARGSPKKLKRKKHLH